LPGDAEYYAACVPSWPGNRKFSISLQNLQMRGCAKAYSAEERKAWR
jgi:hypothetical protein